VTAPGSSAVFRPLATQPRADEARSLGPRLIAPGSVTEGEFGLFETTVAPGAGTAAPHYHTSFTESFYVLEGRLELRVDDATELAGPGDFAFVPRHGLHGFTNTGDVPARMLILFTPGIARENYFRELAELYTQGRRPSDAEVDALATRHDQFNVRDAIEPGAGHE